MHLNRRHKAGIFLTAVFAGTGLLLEFGLRQVAGVTLLGLAATWLIGILPKPSWKSQRVMATGLIVLCAASIVSGTVARSAEGQYNKAVEDERRAAQEARNAAKLANILREKEFDFRPLPVDFVDWPTGWQDEYLDLQTEEERRNYRSSAWQALYGLGLPEGAEIEYIPETPSKGQKQSKQGLSATLGTLAGLLTQWGGLVLGIIWRRQAVSKLKEET